LKHIPTLDGWRGIAILLVLFDHFQFAIQRSYFRPWTETGRHGVTIFFVLSGFLITTGLLSGPIDLKRFYIRRFFRLMPAAWVFLSTLLLLSHYSGIPFTTWPEIKACLLFYRNYAGSSPLSVAGHFWSLSIEEQFYLVWPFLLLFAGKSRARWIAAIGALGFAVFRLLNWEHYESPGLWDRTEVRADALLVGCLLALALSNKTFRTCAQRWSGLAALPAALGLLLAIAFFPELQPLWESVCIATLLTATMLHPANPMTRFLSWKMLAQIGVISYSLYIWQNLFMLFNQTPQILAFSILLALPSFAMASYLLVEHPCIRLGHRLSKRRIPIADIG